MQSESSCATSTAFYLRACPYFIAQVHPVTRVADFPVYLCVSAVELVPLLDGGAVPTDKRDDLVFLSDGFLEPILKARGLCRKENTQVGAYSRSGCPPKLRQVVSFFYLY